MRKNHEFEELMNRSSNELLTEPEAAKPEDVVSEDNNESFPPDLNLDFGVTG